MYEVGSVATFSGLRTPQSHLAIPDHIRAEFRKQKISPRTDLLLKRDHSHTVIFDSIGFVGTIERSMPSIELWFDEINRVTQMTSDEDNGYIWFCPTTGKRYLIFEDELTITTG